MVNQKVKRDERGRIVGFTTETDSGTEIRWAVSYSDDGDIEYYSREHDVRIKATGTDGVLQYIFDEEGLLKFSGLYEIPRNGSRIPVRETRLRQKGGRYSLETTSDIGDRYKDVGVRKGELKEEYWEEFAPGRNRLKELSENKEEIEEPNVKIKEPGLSTEDNVTEAGQHAMDLGREYKGTPETDSVDHNTDEGEVESIDPEIQKQFDFEDENPEGSSEPSGPSHFPRS